MKIINYIIVLLLLPLALFAQKGWEAGGYIGVSNYFGDLNNNYDLTELGPSAGLNGRYNFGHRLCLKASLNYAYIYGDDADSPNVFENTRNLDFKSHIYDLSLAGEINFLPYTHGSVYEYFTPYMLIGASFVQYSPFTHLDDEKHFLRPLGTEGQSRGNEYALVSPAFLYGFGLKYDINYEWSFNIEYSVRWMRTDYLDDVSTVYPSRAQIISDRGEIAGELYDRSGESEIGQLGRQRGDPTRKDQFGIFSVSIMRYFGQVQCPRISKPSAQSWM